MFYRNKLKHIFLISCTIAILFPLVNIYFIFPSISSLLVANTEDEAVRVANHLSSIIVSDDNQLKKTGHFEDYIEEIKEDFKIFKIKVFSANGEVIYSSDHKDEGAKNSKQYFHEIVARGKVYTKQVETGTESLDGQTVMVDVVETYVPIIKSGKFLGAFEIYYDITLRNQAHTKAVFHSSLISFALVFVFFVIIAIALFKADDESAESEQTGYLKIYHSPLYLLILIILSIFAVELTVMHIGSYLPPLSGIAWALLDASLLIMIVSPLLYCFILRPLFLHISLRKDAEEKLRKSHSNLEKHVSERTAELAEANNQIVQIQKMEDIGRLAGGIAHDFNNILSVIIGFSEMSLKELPHEHPVKDNIITVRGAAERAASLTKQLLAFSRKQVLTMKTIDINKITVNMMAMLGRLIPENVMLEFNSQKQLAKVLADSTQIEQILLNLVVNACHAMPVGGTLVIDTTDVEFKQECLMGNERVMPGHYVMLSVKDTGMGMPKEVQEKVFEPFFSTKEGGKGTGMGLATVYGIVKQHKGYIVIDSEIGKGSEFRIYFPTAEDQQEAEDNETEISSLTGNETILVVDDEHLLVKLIVKMLEPLGYRVLTAASGEEALQVSMDFKGNIDLLLSDVIMPGMNGRDLAVELLIERPDTKVIFMSGYTDDAIDDQGVLVKGIVLIHKPVTELKLSTKIREVLDYNREEKPIQPEDIGALHILLVDDSADIRMLIKSYLKDSLCKIETAENGAIALDKFKSGTYDLVLMDMQMPVMDGLTAVIEMRKWEEENQSKQTSVIAFTGNSSQNDIDRGLSAGYNSHLLKPIKKDELVRALHKYSQTLRENNNRSNDTGEDIINEINKEHVAKFMAHIDAELRDIVPGYIDCRKDDARNIQGALEKGDYETVRMLGHSMKGSGGGYGFDVITDIGNNLENAAKAQNHEEIKEWVDKLSDYIDNVKVVYE